MLSQRPKKGIKRNRLWWIWPADVWTDDPTKWPELEWPEVRDYLHKTPGIFTSESMKNRQSREAYNQFTSGWVRRVSFQEKDESSVFMILKADEMPSQRLNEPAHCAWVALNKNAATVVCGHCTCLAGLGESYSDIAASLFKVEAAVIMNYTKKACTDEACKWNNDCGWDKKNTNIHNQILP